jgi:hypothetical protein
MGLGPHRKVKDMRNKGPHAGDLRSNSSSGVGASGMSVKQNKQTGPKDNGPAYPKKDPNIKPFGGK